MKNTASKRMSRLEVKSARGIEALAEEERRKKADALEEWRQQNCARIAWDLFALIEGPKLGHPDNYKKEDGEEDVFVDSHLAYFAMLDRILKHGLNEDGYLEMSKMSTEERAFAVCLENLYMKTDNDDGWLLNKGITDQAIALGIGAALLTKHEISVAEAVRLIDEHRGGPEWRQICGTNEGQEEMDAIFEISTIIEIPPPGRAWVDPGGWR